MKHGKLVRDRIPEIIRKSGGKPKTHVARKKEYWDKLLDKLGEELKELLSARKKEKFAEELADVIEVLLAIGEAKGISRKGTEKLRLKKAEERGAFKKRIILEES